MLSSHNCMQKQKHLGCKMYKGVVKIVEGPEHFRIPSCGMKQWNGMTIVQNLTNVHIVKGLLSV